MLPESSRSDHVQTDAVNAKLGTQVQVVKQVLCHAVVVAAMKKQIVQLQ